jgi:hypothetical protein
MKVSALFCLVIFASIAVPLAIAFALSQPFEINADFAVSYDVTPVADGGDAQPEGIPISCPGGPT